MKRIVLLAVLVVLAGCTGGPDSGTPTPGDPTGDSPTDPTPTPDDGYPPGVSGAGLENASELVRAHADAVERTGYESRLVVTTAFADDDAVIGPATITFEARVPADGYPYRLSENNSGGLSEDYEDVTWANESVQASNRTTDPSFGEPTSQYELEEPAPEPYDGPAMVLGEFLHGEFDVAEETDDRVTLRATGVDAGDFDANVTGYEGELVVDRRGRILTATLTFETTSNGEDLVTNLAYDLDVGDVDVEKPGWVEGAIHEATAITVEASVEGDSIAVTNTGRETIPEGHAVTLSEERENGWSGSLVELDRPVDPGETVYVYYDGGQAEVAQSPPDDPDQLSGTYRVTVADEEFDRVAEAVVDADEE